MRSLLTWIGRAAIGLALILIVIWWVAPTEPVDITRHFKADQNDGDLISAFVARDAGLQDVTPGAERKIVWGAGIGERSNVVFVYVHGFSATAAEIRPVPENVAATFDANLVFVRLTGHGRGGSAMALPEVSDWVHDLDEALAVASQIGDRVIVLATSTGATLAAAMLAEGRDNQVEGIALISPNFRIVNPLAAVLTFPGARYWAPTLFGAEREFKPQNEDHAKFWTTRYPTSALFPMAALVKRARSADYSDVHVPAVFLFSETDQVVDHRVTRSIASDWGGVTEVRSIDPVKGDDPMHHVIAGDILSPGGTPIATEILVKWVKGLQF